MNRKSAVFAFLGICILLAIFLLTRTITPLVGGIVFALALLAFGLLSRGFTRT